MNRQKYSDDIEWQIAKEKEKAREKAHVYIVAGNTVRREKRAIVDKIKETKSCSIEDALKLVELETAHKTLEKLEEKAENRESDIESAAQKGLDDLLNFGIFDRSEIIDHGVCTFNENNIDAAIEKFKRHGVNARKSRCLENTIDFECSEFEYKRVMSEIEGEEE